MIDSITDKIKTFFAYAALFTILLTCGVLWCISRGVITLCTWVDVLFVYCRRVVRRYI